MARAKTKLPPAAAIRALADSDGRLAVRVTPGARCDALEISAAGLLAKVRARPEAGKANQAVQALIASALKIAPSQVQLLRGATSREKLWQIGD
jgi:uncharacterized protein